MAIYQRDRSFQNIFSEIEVNVIPLRFVRKIIFILKDGSEIVMEDNEFSDAARGKNDIEELIKDLDFYHMLQDLQLTIDYERVEKDVLRDVSQLLD